MDVISAIENESQSTYGGHIQWVQFPQLNVMSRNDTSASQQSIQTTRHQLQNEGRDEGSKDHETKRNNHPKIQNISQIKRIDTDSEKIVRSHEKKIL
ncbi:hypothetical protein HOLDEFILI_02371 [Holdemania filiformis DSM 12042]|uniref:Uncharacterized protein n=1 Tax=Holdemania filiformis DSM 12042 TaxID=545696 RepID=B9Y966_9FIRM|nr:hypothetical protein HOLDEFILI_02371 [Holdemania filiformis DSM 12042]